MKHLSILSIGLLLILTVTLLATVRADQECHEITSCYQCMLQCDDHFFNQTSGLCARLAEGTFNNQTMCPLEWESASLSLVSIFVWLLLPSLALLCWLVEKKCFDPRATKCSKCQCHHHRQACTNRVLVEYGCSSCKHKCHAKRTCATFVNKDFGQFKMVARQVMEEIQRPSHELLLYQAYYQTDGTPVSAHTTLVAQDSSPQYESRLVESKQWVSDVRLAPCGCKQCQCSHCKDHRLPCGCVECHCGVCVFLWRSTIARMLVFFVWLTAGTPNMILWMTGDFVFAFLSVTSQAVPASLSTILKTVRLAAIPATIVWMLLSLGLMIWSFRSHEKRHAQFTRSGECARLLPQ